jgi:5-methylcytosine-specific restriction endonuclease McrA
MASRCNSTYILEVHHINRGADNTLSNAQVLCSRCHKNTPSYGKQGIIVKPFSEETKKLALKRAGNKCECVRDNCH